MSSVNNGEEVTLYGTAESVTDSEKTFDYNTYATKKTVAKGLLNIGLLTSNASQLKIVLERGPSHQYYSTCIVLIAMSTVLQVTVGVLLLAMGINKVRTGADNRRVNVLNNVTVGIVAFILVINVFITAFVTQSEN